MEPSWRCKQFDLNLAHLGRHHHQHPSGGNGKNAILRYYLVATGGGGTSVISLGEVDPNFVGTKPTPALIVPGAPGRDVTDLTSLQRTILPADNKHGRWE